VRGISRSRELLAIAYEFAVDSLFLHVQMIFKNLVEALQAHALRVFFFVVPNRRPAPDALDHEGRLVLFLSFFHGLKVMLRRYDLISTTLNDS
jgi:hypothetical protein